MVFTLTKQQQMVQSVIREFTKNEVEPIAAEVDAEERFPRETFEKMAEAQMLGLPFSRKYGGAGGDTVSYAICIEELSRHCATTGVMYSAHVSLGSNPINEFGTEAQKQKYLTALARGEKMGAFGLTEPNAGTDSAAQQTSAVLDGENYILNGTKVFITNGGEADIYIVFAMTDKSKGNRGISAFIVEKDFPGFSIGKKEEKLGIRGSATTELIFDNCIVPGDNLLLAEGQGFKVAMKTLDGGRIGIAAQALGIAQGALDQSVEYMKSRIQFSKPIAAFQGLQWMVAEMGTAVDAARLLVYRAAFNKDHGLPYSKEAAMAKLFASETAMSVTTKAVQLHGGYGYTRDYPVERMMRDAKITEIYEGTSEVQKMVISASLLK